MNHDKKISLAAVVRSDASAREPVSFMLLRLGSVQNTGVRGLPTSHLTIFIYTCVRYSILFQQKFLVGDSKSRYRLLVPTRQHISGRHLLSGRKAAVPPVKFLTPQNISLLSVYFLGIRRWSKEISLSENVP